MILLLYYYQFETKDVQLVTLLNNILDIQAVKSSLYSAGPLLSLLYLAGWVHATRWWYALRWFVITALPHLFFPIS